MPRHDRYPGESDEPDRITDEDVSRLIDEVFQGEEDVEVEVPQKDILSIKNYLMKFNVIDAADAEDEDVELIWHHLSKDPSIGKDFPSVPSIFKDFSYSLVDFRTRLYRSHMPLPARWSDFNYYSRRLNQPGRERFSNRMWIIEKMAIPNLTSLGVPKDEVVRHAYGDEEGKIKAAEYTRFLGWLTSQSFMNKFPSRLAEYKADNEIRVPTLMNIGKLAIFEVQDARRTLREDAPLYEQSYPHEVRAIQQYQEMLAAMDGIYNLFESLILGE